MGTYFRSDSRPSSQITLGRLVLAATVCAPFIVSKSSTGRYCVTDSALSMAVCCTWQMFEREQRREKFLEAKHKENKLRKAAAAARDVYNITDLLYFLSIYSMPPPQSHPAPQWWSRILRRWSQTGEGSFPSFLFPLSFLLFSSPPFFFFPFPFFSFSLLASPPHEAASKSS